MRQEEIIHNDGKVWIINDYLSTELADQLYDKFYRELPWRRDTIKIFGQEHQIPRKNCYMAAAQDLNYSYSNQQMKVESFHPDVADLIDKIKADFGFAFNAVLANLYEHGQHANGWHADNEKELGANPHIASVSLGESRKFKVKHQQKGIKKDIVLTHGSLLIMEAPFQQYWKHSIPKTAKKVMPRVNLTLRKIIKT